MRSSEHFNLNIVEGSDKVNLLTQMNPNTEEIDEQMFKNQNAGVQSATELLSGTVHAITRSVPDASMIRFTAVSRFTAGDTFTVDGIQVSALLPSGEQLPDGAFIIGSEVLCVLKGTLLTVFASGGAVALARDAEKLGGQMPTYYATKTEVDSAQNTANSAGELAESNKQSIDNMNTIEKAQLGYTGKFSGNVGYYEKKNNIVFVTMECAPNSNVSHADVVASGFPKPSKPFFGVLTTNNGNGYSFVVNGDGVMSIYYPAFVTPERVDVCFMYFSSDN